MVKTTEIRRVRNVCFTISYFLIHIIDAHFEVLKVLERHSLEQAISMALAALIFVGSQIHPPHLQTPPVYVRFFKCKRYKLSISTTTRCFLAVLPFCRGVSAHPGVLYHELFKI
jgi:hypothetical protein